jgi:acyl-CoA reductase-like NAD-dependent aldehyde dehydrogenase
VSQDYDGIYYAGGFQKPKAASMIEVIDPSTRVSLAAVPDCDASDVELAVASAAEAMSEWAATPARVRGQLLTKLGSLIRRDLERLAEQDCRDIGRTIGECRGHVLRSAETCEYCGGLADKLEGRNIIQKSSHALAAGNAIVLKLSPLACLSAFALAPLIEECGIPPGVFNFVTGGAAAGRALVSHEQIDLVSFTGSAAAGRAVASAAGIAGKPVYLELGGKAPALVFADADIQAAANDLAGAAFGSTGQSCTAATRILVEETVYDKFCQAFVETAARYESGDPFAPESMMGPLISEEAWKRAQGLAADAVERGARLLTGTLQSALPPQSGFFMESIVLSDVPDDARIAREEVFGPVTCLYSFATENEGLSTANASPYGLAAGLYTRDHDRARRLSSALRAGNVWVNGYKKLDPALPFGGVKGSGFGRECGIDGVLAFTRPKAVVECYE